MLIVARRKGQRIRIGDDIEVIVTEISRGEVRLGIVAPQTVPVVRQEVREAVEQANRQAAASTFETAPTGAALVANDLAVVVATNSRFGSGTRS